MKNIHVIKTDKPSRLLKQNNNKLILSKQIVYSHISKHLENINQNIYITSDEEIIGGKEWFLDLRDNFLFKNQVDEPMSKILFPNCKKIILSTDTELINDGVQPIDDEFLEWFIKNPSCEEVKTERLLRIGDLTQLGEIFDITESWKFKGRTLYYCGESKRKGIWKLEEELIINNFNNTYKIIIPKEEILPQQIWNEEKMEGIKKLIQKQELIEIIKSDEDAKIFVEALENIPEPNDKLKKAFRDFGKQETLEEAAVRLYSDRLYPMYGSIRRDAFTNGAKWQQEQHNFLPGLIKQFDPKEGEINGEQWTAVHFLKWLELNKFKIVK